MRRYRLRVHWEVVGTREYTYFDLPHVLDWAVYLRREHPDVLVNVISEFV